ncbi:MAG: GNAT family N-acetyltransferase [Butyrivibrio sp.]|nr:GNAT family N-acetyltransferase [Butyrivibrio sp.]
MLKKILFYIDKKNRENPEVVTNINEAAEYVKSCGFEVAIKIAGGVSDEKESQGDSGMSGASALGDSLFLTDSGLAAKLLTETGAYVVGISHKLNGSEDFAGLKYVFTDIQDVDIDSYIKAYQRYAHLPWEVIKTPRLLIRETTLDDVDKFYELYKDPEMTKYMEGLFENPEDEKRYQKDYIEKVYGLMGFGIWTVVKRDDNTVIGRAGYSVRNGFDDIELGFLIGKDYQGQGYAYEACDAILQYGKEILLFEKVQTLVKEENTVSINLCKKLGFTELDTVEVEENIYGEEYNTVKTGGAKQPNAARGKYVRLMKQL